MEVCFGAYLLFKKIKFLLPLVKHKTPKTYIMGMVVSKRHKVKQHNYSLLMSIMEKILLGIFL